MGRDHLRDGKGTPQQGRLQIQAPSRRQADHCLDIPDDYDYMDPMLIQLLRARVLRYFPR
jgi:predicted protein tyrosine phosphatase